MNCKVRRCLCCVPVHHGTMMIGAIHVFRLIANIALGEYFMALIEIFPALAFIAMIRKDAKQARFIFFVSFCTYASIINLQELYLRKYPSEEERISKQAYFKNWCTENM